MASTYFRLTAMDARGAELTLSALELHGANGRLDNATITSSHEPVAGALSALGDGDLLTSCTFAAPDVASPGFWIGFELETAQDVSAVLLQGQLYALTLCERIGGNWSLVMSVQDSGGLPVLTRPAAVEKQVAVVSDLTILPGFSGVSASTLTASAGGGTFGTGGAHSPAFAKLASSPVVSWVGLRAKLVYKIITDNASRKHVGFLFQSASGVGDAYRLVFLDNGFVQNVYQGGREQGQVGATISTPGPTAGVVNTLEISVAAGGVVTVYQNGQLIGTISSADNRFPNVVAGVFVYGLSAEIQRVELSSQVSSTGPAVTRNTQVLPIPQSVPPLPQAQIPFQVARPFLFGDLDCGGQHHIYGTVELFNQGGNIPLPRRVRLHRSRDGLLVRETWSNAQGQYRFEGISERYTYDVIAWDHEGLQQSVVANDLTPEVMP